MDTLSKDTLKIILRYCLDIKHSNIIRHLMYVCKLWTALMRPAAPLSELMTVDYIQKHPDVLLLPASCYPYLTPYHLLRLSFNHVCNPHITLARIKERYQVTWENAIRYVKQDYARARDIFNVRDVNLRRALKCNPIQPYFHYLFIGRDQYRQHILDRLPHDDALALITEHHYARYDQTRTDIISMAREVWQLVNRNNILCREIMTERREMSAIITVLNHVW
jgi:hypothetical protein